MKTNEAIWNDAWLEGFGYGRDEPDCLAQNQNPYAGKATEPSEALARLSQWLDMMAAGGDTSMLTVAKHGDGFSVTMTVIVGPPSSPGPRAQASAASKSLHMAALAANEILLDQLLKLSDEETDKEKDHDRN